MDHRRHFSRPRERDPQELAEELSERRSRALEEPLDLRLRQREPFPVVEVRNPLHRTTYLVLRPTFPDRDPALCTCPDFTRRGLGTCKHIEATDRWLTNHPAATPSSPPKAGPSAAMVWREIDLRLAREPPRGVPWSRRLREPGAALIDTAPSAKGR
ncbi:MAG TPA: hypothetical protein VEG66_01665 [Thermoplasmata archaeon]|nr:hypothetical protein [Thermoplasmata archaeon]